ncbi:hypothetical protein [Actinomadura sp. NTSP31]|uniref:hypothetical protein n=1 Tax=Actinomadura sp. NTSP31 TaxID=1735447 RepID=UPI0035C082DA
METAGGAGTRARTAAKTTLLRDAGADAVLVTGNDDLTEQILKATGGAGADLVLDCGACRSGSPAPTSSATSSPPRASRCCRRSPTAAADRLRSHHATGKVVLTLP